MMSGHLSPESADLEKKVYDLVNTGDRFTLFNFALVVQKWTGQVCVLGQRKQVGTPEPNTK